MAEPWPRGRNRHGGVDEIPLPARGRLWLAGKHFVCPDPEAAMAEVGATMVVCLCEAPELAERYPGYLSWLRSGPAIWYPVPDLHAPAAQPARQLVATIAGHLDAGESLLVHCGAGIGRAGTLAAALLMHYGSDLPSALDTVARSRPGAGPEGGAQAELLRELRAG